MSRIVLAIGLALLLPAAVDALRKPNLRRLAWRNLSNRKAEAVLVTVGTLLGSAIIVASLVVGDTIEDAVQSQVFTSQGPLDESVVIDDPSMLDELTVAIRAADVPNVDGIIPILSTPAVVTISDPDPRGEPAVWIAEIDFDEARAFGADPDTTGFADAGPTPGGGSIVITTQVSGPLDLSVGDVVTVHAYGNSAELTVTKVIERLGLAGWNRAYVAPGTIEYLFDPASAAVPPRAEVAISNTGGVLEGALLSDEVVADLEALTARFDGVDVDPVKADTLEDAKEDGAEFTTLFSGIGSFAVIAGILLIVNLFVMLAEERKPQLGILRAIGYRRHQVTRAFAIEGAFYSSIAAVLGTGLGVGIGWVLVQAITRIFFEDDQFLAIGFAPGLDSMAIGGGLGLVIAMGTIWATAARISRFNVIAAIRDLPQPATRKGTIRTLILASLGVVAGGAMTTIGISGSVQIPALIGLPIAAFSAIPLLRRLIPERVAATLMGATSLIWGVMVFSILPDVMEDADIDVFVFQGVVLVAGAVVISASGTRLWAAAVNGVARFGGGLAARLGMIYPLARRGRTGLLLAMFSLVIFTITFLSVFAGILSQQTTAFADDSRAGHDIFLTTNRTNPAGLRDVTDIQGVATAAEMIRGVPEFETEDEDNPRWVVTGIDDEFLTQGTPILGRRSAEYETDLEAFEAIISDPSLIIIDDFFLDNSGGPGGQRYEIGETVTILNPPADGRQDATIIGIMASDFLFAGAYMSRDFVSEFLPADSSAGRFFVTALPGVDPETLAATINAELLDFGADAATFGDVVETEVSETLAIFRLFQGFLSLGLIIGIAGLGVVLIRAVHERRRQIGVLRALGFQRKVVRRAFLVEAGFLAGQGVAIGAGLGLVTAYQVLVNSDTFGASDFTFVWPWAALVLIFSVPTIAALLAALGPAARASRISPAVALRTD